MSVWERAALAQPATATLAWVAVPFLANRISRHDWPYYVAAAVLGVVVVTAVLGFMVPQYNGAFFTVSSMAHIAFLWFRHQFEWEILALYVAITASVCVACMYVQIIDMSLAKRDAMRDVANVAICVAGCACAFALPTPDGVDARTFRFGCAVARSVTHALWVSWPLFWSVVASPVVPPPVPPLLVLPPSALPPSALFEQFVAFQRMARSEARREIRRDKRRRSKSKDA